ncbi:Clan MH, family M18, aspartyl aminopeptidase-like metallopeptidase [Histomonas meleagridis]|uniref:Clan MH, family M18, aspartyl aminopeptidase-like metallopeptidase n=1 Tax=Histomonas meleagridis TaxID=135588 RepID=UPI00355AC2AD|nr:Clan MH, family M18, aspartyl aminopeptidase-like metallopeptidase [Histomonas meleagridis]KAH0796168.1 Clan MH, family M18, aspartyl aminopeptidase-like metallopeptidase [Histomonas meleagridis]
MFEDFSNFIQKCPTPFHFCAYARELLKKANFQEVSESEPFPKVKKGFFIRDERALFAWNDNGHDFSVIAGSHCDSPSLFIKPNSEEITINNQKILKCTLYGGGLFYTWVGHDLKLAGRVFYKTSEGVKCKLFNSEAPIAFIPPFEDHFDPRLCGYICSTDYDGFNAIFGFKDSTNLVDYVATKLNIPSDSICHWDLRLSDTELPTLLQDEVITSQNLDDLSNTYVVLKAFLDSNPKSGVFSGLAVFDNEEVGSSTRSGAGSSLINSALKRVIGDDETVRQMKANSIFLSCDTNHATHPNFPDKTEQNHVCNIGKGFAVEIDHNNSVACDMISLEILKRAAKKVGAKIQITTGLNGLSSGSTIGPMTESGTGIRTIDLGIPLLAMHSIRETGAISDMIDEYKTIKELYNHAKKYLVNVN